MRATRWVVAIPSATDWLKTVSHILVFKWHILRALYAPKTQIYGANLGQHSRPIRCFHEHRGVSNAGPMRCSCLFFMARRYLTTSESIEPYHSSAPLPLCVHLHLSDRAGPRGLIATICQWGLGPVALPHGNPYAASRLDPALLEPRSPKLTLAYL